MAKADILFEFGEGMVNLILLVVGILFAIGFIVAFSNGLQTADVAPEAATNFMTGSIDKLAGIFNILPLILYLIFLYIGAKAARQTSENKVFIFVWFFLMIGAIGTFLVLPSNIFDAIVSKSTLMASVADKVPILEYMLENSLFFGVIYFIVTGIALITRERA